MTYDTHTHTDLGALMMNHHQVVNNVQSKLPCGVQLQHMTLPTRTLPKHTQITGQDMKETLRYCFNNTSPSACAKKQRGDNHRKTASLHY